MYYLVKQTGYLFRINCKKILNSLLKMYREKNMQGKRSLTPGEFHVVYE